MGGLESKEEGQSIIRCDDRRLSNNIRSNIGPTARSGV